VADISAKTSKGLLPDMSAAFPRHRFGLLDLALLAVAAGTYFFLGGYLALATQVLVMVIFALSLDLQLGFGGIETLGHAAFYGIGAYGAALYSIYVSPEPISGLLVGALAAGAFALLSGAVVLRTRGLALVMLTLAVATVVHEIANTMRWLTGGDDGLHGYSVSPIFGMFQFDLWGRTAYVYALAVTLVVFVLCRTVANSHFGLTIRAMRDNPDRLQMLGVANLPARLLLYTICGALAGVAGALSAQVVGVVGLASLTFLLSGNVLIALVIGGTGRLYGAIIGAIVFVILSDRAAAIDPFNWLFALGGLLILIVWLAPDGLTGIFARAARRFVPGKADAQ